MAQYQITATDARDFTLRAGERVLGCLHYTEWFSFKAVITLADGATFQVAPRGFWGTTIEVKGPAGVLYTFKMNWSGEILIKSKADAKAFVLKNKSLFKNAFVLHDKHEQELLVVQPDFKWSQLNHDYHLTATDALGTPDAKALLLLVAVHCANYYMTMVSTSLATMVAVS